MQDSHYSHQDEEVPVVNGRTYYHQPSPPSTPALFRSESFDSKNSYDPASPITPRDPPDYGYPPPMHRNGSYSSGVGSTSVYPDPTQFEPGARTPLYDTYAKRHSIAMRLPSFSDTRRRHSYEDPALAEFNASRAQPISPPFPSTGPVVSPGGTKRYPCRYRGCGGCDKTFTTSGHASRHSKIHTSEKGIGCTFVGCPKKFTRADNMKQHLETHFKDRNRGPRTAPKGGPSGVGTSGKVAMSSTAGVRKVSSFESSEAIKSRRVGTGQDMIRQRTRAELPNFESFKAEGWRNAQSGLSGQSSPLVSPTTVPAGFGNLEQERVAIEPRLERRNTECSGLDTLAAAVASQEGG